MFVHHTFIEETHKPILESAIRQHAVVTEPMLAKLYQIALESFNTEGKINPVTGFSWSYIGDDKNAVASATNEQTGFYVQLTGEKAAKNRSLTVGAKWAMQSKANQSLVTKMW